MGIRPATLRRFALGLPGAVERETWETATFRVREKIFMMYGEHERHAWIKSILDEQRALTAQDPIAFFVPPYVGPKGWVGVVLSKANGEEVRELVTEAWRMTAPKRLAATIDLGSEA
jgi:hypothetical protein